MDSSKEVVDDKAYAASPSHRNPDVETADIGIVNKSANPLARNLKGRHMQMIAIGGAIGAGLFVGSGSALSTGGPGALVLGYIIVGSMLLCTVQALAELAVLYPVNGAFYTYIVRFVDPSLGFAVGWDYAIQWLTVLPFELTAAGITIQFWNDTINVAAWISIFLVALSVIQIFGVRGYGEVEFILSIIKILGVVGFIILGIIIDCGGTGPQGYIGAKYWYQPGAFHHGFRGFASVFVVAAFAFSGTELVGLAAAEAADPRKSVPAATKQVFWRIGIFYVLSLFIMGLIVPSDNPNLLNASGAHTKYSPFVIAIKLAGIKVLPSIFNAIITVSVISVANSCTFGSTRTMQALAERGMGPKFLAYVDTQGRPIWGVAVQLLFGCLAYIGCASSESTIFNWLLSLSGLSDFFVWGSICLAHIRFRHAWKAQGYTKSELPYQAALGVLGSYYGLLLNILCMIATFYNALWPVGAGPDAQAFFEAYLAAPIIIALYLGWKIWVHFGRKDPFSFYIRSADMDLTSNMRRLILDDDFVPPKRTLKNLPMRIIRGLI
ncbi:putative general amino acid permease GAP1 [Coleophoma cylindrospora]|uniref:Putative general amino acid permease GAP1 n=1 Tax=Coleophoma cylindrospora TaxID=1849047 RepID=A0A3D8SPY1_9HELO|nr:putative general amino acid permease GAP1 [Coleophoma cylindrospora]